jgi:hypothetical protein
MLPSLVRAILDEAVLPQLHRFSSQAVSNTMYALVMLKLPQGPHVMDALVSRMVVCLTSASEDCTPQAASNAMWALGGGDYSAAALRLQQPLLAFLQKHSAEFTSRDLSTIAISLAKLGHHYPELFSALVEAAKPTIEEFDNQALANLLQSLAILEPTTHFDFFQELQPLLLTRLWDVGEQGLANIAWAYAVVLGDGTSTALALGIFREAMQQEQASVEGLRQLFQLMAVSSSEVQAAVEADQSLRGLRERCGRAYAALGEGPHVTRLDKQVQELLPAPRAELNPKSAVTCYSGIPLRTGLLQCASGQQVAFDWVPPAKYSRHSSTAQQHRELGYVVIRRRMLAKAGWPRAVMIPMTQWERLKDEGARLQYLRRNCGLR